MFHNKNVFVHLLLKVFKVFLLQIQSVRNSGNLTEVQSRLVDLYLCEFIRNGAEMKESQKKELSVVIQKITEEQKKYKYD